MKKKPKLSLLLSTPSDHFIFLQKFQGVVFDKSPDTCDKKIDSRILAKWKELGPVDASKIYAKMKKNNHDLDTALQIDIDLEGGIPYHGQLDPYSQKPFSSGLYRLIQKDGKTLLEGFSINNETAWFRVIKLDENEEVIVGWVRDGFKK